MLELTNAHVPALPMHIPTLHTDRLALLPLSADCDALYASFYTDAEASRPYGGPLSGAAAW